MDPGVFDDDFAAGGDVEEAFALDALLGRGGFEGWDWEVHFGSVGWVGLNFARSTGSLTCPWRKIKGQ